MLVLVSNGAMNCGMDAQIGVGHLPRLTQVRFQMRFYQLSMPTPKHEQPSLSSSSAVPTAAAHFFDFLGLFFVFFLSPMHPYM